MPTLDPDQLALPLEPDSDGDQQALIRSAQEHLVALRNARRFGTGIGSRAATPRDVQVIGQSPAAVAAAEADSHKHLSWHRITRGSRDGGRHDENEVDDSWFGLGDDDARRTVKIRIGKVPKRAAAMVGRRIRRSGRRPHSAHASRASDIDDETEAEEERYEFEAGRDGAGAMRLIGMGSAATPSRRGTSGVYAAASPDDESFVTLELPTRPGAGFPLFGGTDSPTGGLSRIASPASARAETLYPVETTASSSAGPASATGTPLYKQPSQALTVDEYRRPKVSRKATGLSMTTTTPAHHGGNDATVLTSQSKTYRLSAHRKLHRHRTPKHKGKSFADQASAAADFDLSVAEALKQAGVIRDEEERVESDVLWEHQRG